MQKNIWGPLSAQSTTFFPVKHFSPEPMPPLQGTGYRHTDAQAPYNLVPGPSIWKPEPQDAMGGAGLYSTANDYSKLLSCLVSGGSPLLSKQSIAELLRQQELAPEAVQQLRGFLTFPPTSMAPIWQRPGSDDSGELMAMGHSLVGPVNLEDVPGRRKTGTVCWCGIPNLAWWIDPKSGIAATLFTQIMPTMDRPSLDLLVQLEAALYKLVGETRA
jgi:CubicO group peptidase (beta-lactamase class C family)